MTHDDYEQHLVEAIECGWIIPDKETWSEYCRIKDIDEHPLKTKIKAFLEKVRASK